MAITVLDIITDTLAELGVASPGETVSPEDRAYGLNKLNRLLSSWTAEKIAIAGISVGSFAATGSETYTFGPLGTGSLTRPVAIIALGTTGTGRAAVAKMTDANGYNSILDKARQGLFAETAYYDAGYPLATLYLTPKPNTGASIRVHSISPFPQYTAITDAVAWPPGYERAVISNLAVDMGPAYGAPGGAAQLQTLVAMAREAKEQVKQLSAEAIAGSAAQLMQAMAAVQQQGAK